MDLLYKIALGQIPRIGDINARKLVAHFGSVEAVFEESFNAMIKIPGIGENLARYICDRKYLEVAAKEVEFVTKYNIKTFFYLDDDYPERLSNCEDSPVVFFYKGDAELNPPKVLSVVGTRHATSRGIDLCEKILTGLSTCYPDLLIVSGLAYGIDVAAHKTALNLNLPTVGVLAHGLKTIYPAAHRSVAEKMLKNGGLVSDFLADATPERGNFVKRNRVIAGLADATLVVESGVKGGALITADIANSYNREVLAVPGRPNDTWSAGCNNLIKRNKAFLVESSDDIEYFLNWIPVTEKKPVQQNLFEELDEQEQQVYDFIAARSEVDGDTICRETGIPVIRLASIFLQLECKGVIKSCRGNMYRLPV